MRASSWTALDWTYTLLCSTTMAFSYSIVTVGTPIFPQYFRDAHIYSEHDELVNRTLPDGRSVFGRSARKIRTSCSTRSFVHTVYENEVVYNSVMFASYEATQIIAQPLFGLFMMRRSQVYFVERDKPGSTLRQ